MEENIENIETIEEETETTEPVKKKKKSKSNTKIKIIFVLLLLMSIIGLGYYTYSSFNWNADKVCEEFTELDTNLSVAILEKDTDPNMSYFKDKSLDTNGLEYSGTIEVFENKTEALLKKEYYELYDQEMMQVFNEQTIGADLAKVYGTGKCVVYVNGNTLIRFSHHYSEYRLNQLVKYFNTALEGNHQTEKNEPTTEQKDTITQNYMDSITKQVKDTKAKIITDIEAILDGYLAEIEVAEIERLLEIQADVGKYKMFTEVALKCLDIEEKVDDKIKAQADVVNALLDEAQNEYSREKVQEAKDAITLLTHEYFDQYKQDWNKRIDSILWSIKQKEIQDYKNKCISYVGKYYMIDSSYEGEYAYFEGKIHSITTTQAGKILLYVQVTRDEVLGLPVWSDLMAVELDSEISFNHSNGSVVQMWGQIGGMVENPSLMNSGKIPQLNCKYID